MRYPTLFLTAAACIALAGCDVSDTVAPDSQQPSMLIGGSPLKPLLKGPPHADLWQWTDAGTKEVSYAVTIELLARDDLFGDAVDPTLRIVGSPKFLDAAGKTVADAGSKSVSMASLDPVASGTDGYSLVVIAMPLLESQSRSLDAALANGAVRIDVTAELVRTGKSGEDEVLDMLGALLLGDPHPSPTAAPALLIGSSPLKPLQDPLGFDLWFWTDAKTAEVTYWATVDALVDASLLETSDPRMRLEPSAVYRDETGKDILTSKSSVYLAEVDPLVIGNDGYALVVIALPVTKAEANQLQNALSAGSVEVDVSAAVVTTAADGKDEQLDALGTLQVATPRPSEVPVPGKFAR